jgi:hypothetical protein
MRLFVQDSGMEVELENIMNLEMRGMSILHG